MKMYLFMGHNSTTVSHVQLNSGERKETQQKGRQILQTKSKPNFKCTKTINLRGKETNKCEEFVHEEVDHWPVCSVIIKGK